MQASAFMPLWDVGQSMGSFENEFFEQFHWFNAL